MAVLLAVDRSGSCCPPPAVCLRTTATAPLQCNANSVAILGTVVLQCQGDSGASDKRRTIFSRAGFCSCGMRHARRKCYGLWHAEGHDCCIACSCQTRWSPWGQPQDRDPSVHRGTPPPRCQQTPAAMRAQQGSDRILIVVLESGVLTTVVLCRTTFLRQAVVPDASLRASDCLTCLSVIAQLILLLLPVPRSIMMCCAHAAQTRQCRSQVSSTMLPSGTLAGRTARSRLTLFRKKNMTVQGSYSSYMVLKSGTCQHFKAAL